MPQLQQYNQNVIGYRYVCQVYGGPWPLKPYASLALSDADKIFILFFSRWINNRLDRHKLNKYGQCL